MAELRMAQHNNGNNSTSQLLVKPVFHDFMGMKPSDSPVVLAPKAADVRLTEASPSSASVSIGGSSGGVRGPISTTSDVGSERQVGDHFEGVPFYSPRSDFSVSNRLVGRKRSDSDSTFMGSSRDGFTQVVPDSLQNTHLMKMLRNATGGERHRRSNDDEMFLGMQPLRPTSASPLFQPPSGSKVDANISKWEQSILMNVNHAMQHPTRGAQFTPFMHQLASNKIRDANPGPSFISQPAADEGSRTGIKGPGILSSINGTAAASDRTSSGLMLSGGRQKSGTSIVEPESSTPTSRHGLTSASRQMTIFYGGQAHVFDDVHPNKADVIMALAGSNGGSWSSTLSPKSTGKQVHESNVLNGENETGIASNVALSQELHGRLSFTGNYSHASGSGDRVSTPAGGHQGSITAKDTRSPVQAVETRSEDKRAH
ncbi:Protein TIFY 8 [Quillaja saponaria]|uniref:Protein TIFY n=1 Tax=Quillaja saponaria TaxID=32244 RepID=A0AAD7PS27_QUISA|nr:Protein TIFY 8 [Quillaja saponaria]